MANFPAAIIIGASKVTSQQKVFNSFGINGFRQIRSQPNHRWTFTLNVSVKNLSVWRDSFGYMSALESGVNKVTIVHPGYTSILGAATGTITVNGATQTGQTINLSGFAISTTDVFKRGDIIQFANDSKVYMVSAGVSSDGSGNASVALIPKLRKSPADASNVNIAAVEFTMSQTKNATVNMTAPVIGKIDTISLIEELF